MLLTGEQIAEFKEKGFPAAFPAITIAVR